MCIVDIGNVNDPGVADGMEMSLTIGVKEDVMVVIERETTVTNDERMPIMVEYVTEAADVIVVLEGVVELMKGVKRAVEMSEQ